MKENDYIKMSGCGHTFFAYLIGIILTVLLCIFFGSCASTKTVEKVNVKDSIVYHHKYDTTRITITDSARVEAHVVADDSSHLAIQFGAGGGTYNAKTGEATNVASVQHTGTHHEQRDSTAFYKNRYEAAKITCYDLQEKVSNYSSELEKERKVPKRSGYDRFCSCWFWVTAILLLAVLAFWICDKIPATKPYTTLIKGFFKFL